MRLYLSMMTREAGKKMTNYNQKNSTARLEWQLTGKGDMENLKVKCLHQTRF